MAASETAGRDCGPPSADSGRTRAGQSHTLLIVAAALLGLLFTFVLPLFRVIPLPTNSPGTAAAGSSASAAPSAFDPVAFAEGFWAERLAPAAARATDATALLAALRRDPAAAARQHAHVAGVGGSGYYFFRGAGRVAAVERNRVLLDVAGAPVALGTGPVFGNTVRDGTGLLDVNDFPGLTEFNAVSAALNARVEKEILPALRTQARVGAMLAFAGCAEAPESLPDDGPLLRVVPVSVEVAK